MIKKNDIRIFDISLPLYQGMLVYPNNSEFRVRPIQSKTSFHSEITMGSHAGTHVDAPRHVFAKGQGVDDIKLQRIIGECRVLDMTKVKTCVTVKDFRKSGIKPGERILIKTSNSKRGYKKFYNDYVYVDGDAAEYLAKKRSPCSVSIIFP